MRRVTGFLCNGCIGRYLRIVGVSISLHLQIPLKYQKDMLHSWVMSWMPYDMYVVTLHILCWRSSRGIEQEWTSSSSSSLVLERWLLKTYRWSLCTERPLFCDVCRNREMCVCLPTITYAYIYLRKTEFQAERARRSDRKWGCSILLGYTLTDIDDPEPAQPVLGEIIKLWVTVRGFSMTATCLDGDIQKEREETSTKKKQLD